MPILAEAGEPQEDGIGEVLAREDADPHMILMLRVTDARSIQERIIWTDVPMPRAEPVWRVTPDRRYVVLGSIGRLFAIQIQ